MKWQANGELAGSDLYALASHLQQVEPQERLPELERLGRKYPEA